MADQRLIGDILSERRRSLGLSIDRVVSDTKLQRRMVEAFELSDFDSMPPKGYAQASLASYARYLGLNPNEILRVYDDQLYEFQYETSMNAQTSRERGGYRASESFERPVSGRAASSRARSVSFERQVPNDRRDYYARSPQNDPRFVAQREQDVYRDGYYGGPQQGGQSARRTRSESRARSGYGADHVRSVDRGLYDSGYRRPTRAGLYQSEEPYREVRTRRVEREPYGYAEDRAYNQDHAAAQGRRGERDRRQSGGRGEVQIVTLDDGYQGGSGGYGPDAYRYQQRPPQGDQRESFAEVLRGIVDSIRKDSNTLSAIALCLACGLVIALIVAVSSCTRGEESGQNSNIPVTSVASQGGTVASTFTGSSTQLASSVDLNNLPANSILNIAVNEDALSPWIEVRIDDVGKEANIFEPGSSIQFTVTRNAYVLVSDASAVCITVNGTQVTPTPENSSYVLRASVASDQLPQEPAA